MRRAHASNSGAFGLELEGGGMEMVDAPMVKQAENTVRLARGAGLDVPEL